MNKNFYKKKQKREIDDIMGAGALFTLIGNSILIFSFFFFSEKFLIILKF